MEKNKNDNGFISLSDVYKMLDLPTESFLTSLGVSWMKDEETDN